MKSSLIISGIIVWSLIISSCTYDETTENTTSDCDTNYTYEAHVVSLITTECVSCHSAGGNDPILTTYAEVEASLQAVKNEVVIDKSMPPSGLTADEIKIISCWIDQGNPEN